MFKVFFDNFYNTAAVYPAPLRTARVLGKLQKELFVKVSEFNRVYIYIINVYVYIVYVEHVPTTYCLID